MELLLEHMESHPQSQNRKSHNAMTPNKKSSAAENFSMKFSRRVKNATPTVTSSLVAPVTESFRYGDSLANGPKMWHSCWENKPVVISYFIFRPSFTICIFDFYLSPLSSTFFSLFPFPQHVYFIIA
jgi:hypothetical protein